MPEFVDRLRSGIGWRLGVLGSDERNGQKRKQRSGAPHAQSVS
jgi:hypothetical protein